MNYKTHFSLKLPIYIMILVISVISCDCTSKNSRAEYPRETPVETNRIEARKDFLQKERESIEAYQKDYDLEMTRTGTGLYYKITEDAPGEEVVESNDVVEYAYNISTLHGTLLYSSEELGTATLKIDRQDSEIGLHEALKILGLGDEGLFILPSHLAFGVAGDQNKVPPMTPLVYELKIINIQKSKS